VHGILCDASDASGLTCLVIASHVSLCVGSHLCVVWFWCLQTSEVQSELELSAMLASRGRSKCSDADNHQMVTLTDLLLLPGVSSAVLGLLDLRSLCDCSCVSKTWCQAMRDESTWRNRWVHPRAEVWCAALFIRCLTAASTSDMGVHNTGAHGAKIPVNADACLDDTINGLTTPVTAGCRA
jgi:F-box domain